MLAEDPLVIGIGEAHAQKGTEKVTSSTQRFREQLLPMLKGRASDIVLELMVAEGKCGEAEKQVEKNVEKPVTESQATTNKSEFVLLAERASALGIRPHVLRPACADYQRVAKAGPDGIVEMLTMIATLSADTIGRILERNDKGAVHKTVLAYGGAMHNDPEPKEGREAWSFGPTLAQRTKGRYVAIDLIVREYIKDNDAWRSLPWYPHFDPAAHPDQTTLFRVGPSSYVLIFGKSPPAAGAAQVER